MLKSIFWRIKKMRRSKTDTRFFQDIQKDSNGKTWKRYKDIRFPF